MSRPTTESALAAARKFVGDLRLAAETLAVNGDHDAHATRTSQIWLAALAHGLDRAVSAILRGAAEAEVRVLCWPSHVQIFRRDGPILTTDVVRAERRAKLATNTTRAERRARRATP